MKNLEQTKFLQRDSPYIKLFQHIISMPVSQVEHADQENSIDSWFVYGC